MEIKDILRKRRNEDTKLTLARDIIKEINKCIPRNKRGKTFYISDKYAILDNKLYKYENNEIHEIFLNLDKYIDDVLEVYKYYQENEQEILKRLNEL